MKSSRPSFTYRIYARAASLMLCLLTFMPFVVGAQTTFPAVIPFVGATGTAMTPQTQTQTSAPKPQLSAITSQTVRKAQTPRIAPTPTPSYITSTIEQALQSFRQEYNNKLQTLTASIQNTPTYTGGGYSRSVDAVGQSAIDTSIASLSTSIQNNATLRNTLLLNATVSGLFSGSATLTDSVLNGSLYLSDISAPSVTTNRLYAIGGEIYFNGSPIAAAGPDSWTESGSDVYRASGKVGIGTTNPTTALEVVGDITSKGTEWTVRSSSLSASSVTYGNGIFVAVSNAQYMTSPDGVNWKSYFKPGGTGFPQAVTYGNGQFVAVMYGGSGSGAMTSSDGVTWTGRSTGGIRNMNSITYGNGIFVAVGFSGTTNAVIRSLDGVTWTQHQTNGASGDDWKSVTYGNGQFVALSSSGSVMTSPDGITWTQQTLTGTGTGFGAITYGNGLFVIAGYGSGSDSVYTSPDGITWTSRSLDTEGDYYFESITYGNGLFVAADVGAQIATSPDGINWKVRLTPLTGSGSFRAITYGNGMFVATGDSVVMTSGKTETNALATNNLYQGEFTLMSGNMGIGTSTSASRLAVSGSIMSTSLLGGATTLSTDANGNIIRTPSDATLKTDVHTIETALEKVQKLRGVSYNWIDQERFGTSTEIGLIAQEVELVVPEVVKSGGTYKSVNYQNLVALLIEAIKELSTSVTSIASWFTEHTLTIAKDRFLNVEGTSTFKGNICVDDICITNDQFKSLFLQQGGSVQAPAPETPTEPEAPTGESAPTSDEVTPDASVSSEEPTSDSVLEQAPAPETPAPEAPVPAPEAAAVPVGE